MPGGNESVNFSDALAGDMISLPIHKAEGDGFALREPVALEDYSEYTKLQAEAVDMLVRPSLEDTQRVHATVARMFKNRKHGGNG